jgi:lipopolysaccharide/colanic/teichoic acid biosynthesis glycosyltransferase
MKVLIVHQNFVDHRHPGGTRHLELAQELVRRGHECTIVAGSVDYLTGEPIAERAQVLDGVSILRAYALPTLHSSYLGRAMSYCSFMVTCVWTGLRCGQVDVVLGSSPPMFQLPSTWLIAALRRRPLVLEIRDLWPEFPIEMGILKDRWIIGLARRVESFFYRKAMFVIANSPGFRDYLLEKGVPARSLAIVPNGVDTSMFAGHHDGRIIREQFGIRDEFLVTYAGAMGEANHLDVLLDAAARLKGRPDIRFLLVGGGKLATHIADQVSGRGLSNVTLGGVVPKSRMPDVLAASNVCVASLRNLRMFRTTYPNKVFDYMAAGRPTLLLIDGVIRDVIEAADGGRFIPPDDADQLAQAILEYQSDPALCARQGQAAREYVKRHFDRRRQAIELESALQRAADRAPQLTVYRTLGKRVIDVLVAATFGLLVSPVILLAALLIRWRMGRPVLFRQPRPGMNGRMFTLLKFRSMSADVDERGNLLPDHERLTILGRILRSLSIDELPQLWNVLRGDMSLIGPRPLLAKYMDRYSRDQARRHEVRPGITGWAQVHGRNLVSWDDRLRMDVWYVDHCGFWVDFQVIAKTILCLISRRGISANDHATMPEFMGSETSATASSRTGEAATKLVSSSR